MSIKHFGQSSEYLKFLIDIKEENNLHHLLSLCNTDLINTSQKHGLLYLIMQVLTKYTW